MVESNSYRKRLWSEVPFFGPWRRRRAIRALAHQASPEAAGILAEFATLCRDNRLLSLTLAALESFSSPACIDRICAVWAATRHPILTDLIRGKNWIASSPAQIRVLTALKSGRVEAILAGESEVIDPLVESCSDADSEIASGARECLGQLRSPAAIDALCARWVRKRETAVAAAVEQAGYVANQPLSARVWTALKAGHRTLLTDGGLEVVEPLVAAAKDSDPEIAQPAAEALQELTDPQAQEALCGLVIDGEEAAARHAAISAHYAPRDPLQRALFYFLTAQWDAYENLDFDQRLLGRAYEAGNRKLRCRIAEKGRQCGRTEWLTAIVGARHERRLGEMTDEEWEAAVAVLRENKRWEDCWQLAQVAPADWSVRLLTNLKHAGWKPRLEQDREALAALSRAVEGCREEPPFLGRLLRNAELLEGHGDAVTCLVLSRDGVTLASASQDQTVRLWRPGDQAFSKALRGHTDWVDCLALSPDERALASGSRDNTVILWRWPEGELLHRLQGHTDDVRCLAFSHDGGVLASGGSDTSIRLWSAPDGQSISRLTGHSDVVTCLAFSPQGDVLASGSYDNDVRLWSLSEARPIATLKGHKAMVNCLALTQDGEHVISGSKDRSIMIWSLSDRTKLRRLKGHRDDVTCLAISPDGSLLASGSWDTTARLWGLPGGELLDTLGAAETNDGHESWVSCLAFSPDGKVLVSGGFDHTVRLWSVPGGAPLKTLEGHQDRVKCVRFSPDGRTLITGSADRTIRIWKSELARLRRLPVGRTTVEDFEWVENVLSNSKLSDAERGWIEFLFALMRARRRYDIEVGEAARISIGEFDIELEP
ncbi:MAG: HEAT repeat domain-containing protein [Verrucomicrobia bacterium]|nr:HEAT repeat domain-containing protein [Verrucomicrobiota bacterium]